MDSRYRVAVSRNAPYGKRLGAARSPAKWGGTTSRAPLVPSQGMAVFVCPNPDKARVRDVEAAMHPLGAFIFAIAISVFNKLKR